MYAATKGAIDAMTRSLAAELGPQGIRVNTVAPGVVDTDMWARNKAIPGVIGLVEAQTPLRRWSAPEDVADVVVFLAGDAARFVTGETLCADGGHGPDARPVQRSHVIGGERRRAAGHGLARAGVVPIAAFAVHQLRYLLAFGGGAGAELQRQGHSYLHSAVPWLVLALALTGGAFLSSLGRALAGQRTVVRYGISLLGLWLACTTCLVAIYSGQELLEGLFATGHPAGLAGVFGAGGWWAVPAAACVGLVLAALLHGARWLLGEVAARRLAGLPRGARPRGAPPASRRRRAPAPGTAGAGLVRARTTWLTVRRAEARRATRQPIKEEES